MTMPMLCSSKQVLKIKHSDYLVEEAKQSCHIVCENEVKRKNAKLNTLVRLLLRASQKEKTTKRRCERKETTPLFTFT